MVRLPSHYCSAEIYTIFSNPYASLYLGDTLLTLTVKAIGPMQKRRSAHEVAPQAT